MLGQRTFTAEALEPGYAVDYCTHDSGVVHQ